jgi:hypothetical protein
MGGRAALVRAEGPRTRADWPEEFVDADVKAGIVERVDPSTPKQLPDGRPIS